MIEANSREDAFALNLIADTPVGKRCPYLCADESGAYCGKNLSQGENISEERRMVCDNYSLQLWCLDIERYKKCIVFQDNNFIRTQ